MKLADVKAMWPELSALAAAGVIVAKQLGYLANLNPDDVGQLINVSGLVLGGMIARSGMASVSNASMARNAVKAADTAANAVAVQVATMETQTAALTEANRAVVAAAVAVPTSTLIAAAGNAAGVVTQVVGDVQAVAAATPTFTFPNQL